jgi:hypothetical protein
MNVITKENGTIYTSGLDKSVIDWHKKNGFTIAAVNRTLTYEDDEYKDDITPEEVEAGQKAVRAFLYVTEADPLFFKYQRGEIEKQVWLDKVAEIKGD